MAAKDYYTVMGVPERATADEIKTQYRRLAKEHHPDSNKNDPKSAERFKEISEAYQVLGDQKKRTQYDEMRRLGAFESRAARPRPGAGQRQGAPGGPQNFKFDEINDVGGIGGLGDLFSSMFGGGGGARGQRPVGPEPGQTIETSLDVPFKIAATGGKVPIDLEVNEECATCSGSGAAKGARVQACHECNGRGSISFGQGGFAVNRPCPMCLGKGQLPTEKCRDCKGAGETRSKRKVIITVPAGVDTGGKIRLKGQGGRGQRGGAPGDIVITFRVHEDTRWMSDGLDLITHAKINVAQAMLGSKASVETPDEKTVAIKIPPGTSSGKRFRVRGQGIAKDGKQGDLLVEVEIVVPEKLSADEIRMIERFAESAGLER